MTIGEQLTLDDAAMPGAAKPPCVAERAGMIIAEVFSDALADVGGGSLTEIFHGRDRAKRARFLKLVADYFLLDASFDDDYEDEGLMEWLARIGAATLAEDMLIRFVCDEQAARRPS